MIPMAMNRLKEEIIQCAIGPIVETEPAKASRRYIFPADFIGFSGHFPGHPILPAFAQVMAALIVLDEWKGRSHDLLSMERAKFRMEIHPGQEISVQCRQLGQGNAGAFEARITAAEGLAASFFVKTI